MRARVWVWVWELELVVFVHVCVHECVRSRVRTVARARMYAFYVRVCDVIFVTVLGVVCCVRVLEGPSRTSSTIWQSFGRRRVQ